MHLSKDIITILLGLFGPLIHCVKATQQCNNIIAEYVAVTGLALNKRVNI